VPQAEASGNSQNNQRKQSQEKVGDQSLSERNSPRKLSIQFGEDEKEIQT
jgi:hypothetical protein